MAGAGTEVECKDVRCPVHGALSVRGKTYEGTVVSDRMQRSVIVEWPRVIKSQKYGRFKRRTTRITAHNPPCINAKVGDRVKIQETRKLAKTINFVVLGKL